MFEYRDANQYLVHRYAIMPDHLHLLSTTAAKSPAKIMQLIKGRFSYELKRQFGVGRSPWQEGFASRRIATPNEFQRVASYIEDNPVKAHLCNAPEVYRFSSASGRHRLDPMPELGLKPLEVRVKQDNVAAEAATPGTVPNRMHESKN